MKKEQIIGVRVTADTKKKFEAKCKEDNLYVADIIRMWIYQYLKGEK